MMSLARRASLLVAFSLLTSAAAAYAECAWVLWARMLAVSRGTEQVAHEEDAPVTAYPTYLDCEEGRRLKSAIESVNRRDREKDAARRLDFTTQFTCLPDTVDPRGPKAK